MEKQTGLSLEQIIQSRNKKDTIIGGEYFAFFGLLLILTYLFSAFIFSDWWIWLLSIGIGWLSIISYEYYRYAKDGRYSTRIQSEIYSTWIIIGGFVLPIILIVFPNFLKLYPGKAICPLTYLVTGIGVALTGVICKDKGFKLGGFVFLIGSFLSVYFNNGIQQLVIFMFVMLLGLVIPGLVSKYNEKR